MSKQIMKNYWHIWSDPLDNNFLESYVDNLSKTENNSLVICSAEEAYYPASTLIDKTIPIDSDGWPMSFGLFNQFKQKLKNLKSVDIIIGTNDSSVIADYSNLGNVHTWFNFFLYRAFSKLVIDHSHIPILSEKIFLSFNTKAHYHRCLLMDMLAKHDLLRLGYYSWHNQPTGWSDQQYQWQHWNPIPVSIDGMYDPLDISRLDIQHHLPSEFTSVFMILVPETSVEYIFITEKTWHPILAGKPFLSFAAPGFHNMLKHYGFDLYEEIFDYSFDNELNSSLRAEKICKEISKLISLDLDLLTDQLKHKIDKNKNLALGMLKNEIGVPDIAREFEDYNKLLDTVRELL